MNWGINWARSFSNQTECFSCGESIPTETFLFEVVVYQRSTAPRIKICRNCILGLAGVFLNGLDGKAPKYTAQVEKKEWLPALLEGAARIKKLMNQGAENEKVV